MEIPCASYKQLGEKLIKSGKVAAMVAAGGQATRLKLTGSKGLFPISPINEKTLFQIFAEKAKACSVWAKRDLTLIFMTSPGNDQQIRSYFKEHHNFGVKNILFFQQGTLPFQHLDGTDVYQEGKRLEGPDGNGSALENLEKSGILQQLMDEGISILTFTMIDNPLIDPFDANLIGLLAEKNLDISLIAVEKRGEEKVGLVIEEKEGVKVVEYTEDKGYNSPYANISAFAFTTDFIKKVAQKELPLHVHKKEILRDPPTIALKFEKFIFDYLNFTTKSAPLLYPREEVFAPLKNIAGCDSPEDVKKSILLKDKMIYERISGLGAPPHPFELDFSFYYPTEEMLKRWKGRPLTNDDVYIEG